jgi:hypothetical protein
MMIVAILLKLSAKESLIYHGEISDEFRASLARVIHLDSFLLLV